MTPKIKFSIELSHLWVGVYWQVSRGGDYDIWDFYVCPIPCCLIHFIYYNVHKKI
jgi:hypothetical protein